MARTDLGVQYGIITPSPCAVTGPAVGCNTGSAPGGITGVHMVVLPVTGIEELQMIKLQLSWHRNSSFGGFGATPRSPVHEENLGKTSR